MINDMLSGYRVLDLTDVTGYACGRILASFGADVIKIEPPGGDPWRSIERAPSGFGNIFWSVNNTNKRSITLDLTQPAGIELFYKLVSEADVVVESCQPGYLSGLGIDYQSLAKTNPGIIVTSITPFGQSGPYATFRGSELVACALSGVLKTIGYPDRAPVKEAGDACIYHACSAGFTATMFALYERGNSGLGQHIDVSVQEAAASRNMIALMIYQFDKQKRCRAGDYFSNGSTPPGKVLWELKDGLLSRYLNGRLGGGPSSNPALATWMQEKGFGNRLASVDWNDSIRNPIPEDLAQELETAVAEFFEQQTRAEVRQAITERGIGGTLVQEPADVLADEHIRARDFLGPVSIDNGADVEYPRYFVRISGTEPTDASSAKLPGEDNEEIYGSLLGISDDEIERLRDQRVI
jgi:crotonobetainyl-CoA:carnitine CoA-transferase CaiB-like acyl-CoA transferase